MLKVICNFSDILIRKFQYYSKDVNLKTPIIGKKYSNFLKGGFVGNVGDTPDSRKSSFSFLAIFL
jgi:hypothetical protein